MKRLCMISYTYHEGLTADDRREMVRLFAAGGEAPGVVAHYERLDGRGGFIIQEELHGRDLEKDFEQTVVFSRFMDMENHSITTVEEAFPVFQTVFG
jgi:hypothetical protein